MINTLIKSANESIGLYFVLISTSN